MTTIAIEKVKKGDLFQLIGGKAILVADGYNRYTKKYSYYRYDDINRFGEKKKGTQVTEDLTTTYQDND